MIGGLLNFTELPCFPCGACPELSRRVVNRFLAMAHHGTKMMRLWPLSAADLAGQSSLTLATRQLAIGSRSSKVVGQLARCTEKVFV